MSDEFHLFDDLLHEPVQDPQGEAYVMSFLKKQVLAFAWSVLLPLCAMHSAAAATIASTQQGMQQWRASSGKLIAIAGSYLDTTTYKRSLTFYFEEKPGAEWLHVPVMESEADHTLTLFSASEGDELVEDAVVTTQGTATYLIVAAKKTAGVVTTWYKFGEAGSAFPDGPGYLFKPVGSHAYAKNTRPSIESVLQKEVRLKAKR